MSGTSALSHSSIPSLDTYRYFKAHHLAGALVAAAKTGLRDSLNLALAYENLQKAYDIAIDIIKKVYVDQHGSSVESRLRQQGVPLGVTEELVEILHYDRIQQEHPLIYQAVKTLRIFLDLTFLIGKNSSLKIDPQTHKNMVLNILDIFETLPSEAVQTNYELRCCLAAAIVLNDDFVEMKAFVLGNIGSVIKAFATKSPGELAQPMLEQAQKSYRLADTSWWPLVLSCHLTSRVVFSLEQQHNTNAFKMRTITQGGKDAPDSVVNQYAQKHIEHLSQYRNYRESAFCVLEDLAHMLEKSIRAGGKDSSLPIQILNGVDHFPGVREFMVLETPKISEFLSLVKTKPAAAINLLRRQSYWRVQYRAIEVLFNVATDLLAPDAVWQQATTILVTRPTPVKIHKKVELLYKERLKFLKQNLAFPDRTKYAEDAKGEANYQIELEKRKKENEEINERAKFIRKVVAPKKAELEEAPIAKEKTRLALSQKTQEIKDLKGKLSGTQEQGFTPEMTEEDKKRAEEYNKAVEDFNNRTAEVKMDEEELALLETKEALLKF